MGTPSADVVALAAVACPGGSTLLLARAAPPAPAGCGAPLPLRMPASALEADAHSMHLRAAEGLLRWLLLKSSGTLSLLQIAHRMLNSERVAVWVCVHCCMQLSSCPFLAF